MAPSPSPLPVNDRGLFSAPTPAPEPSFRELDDAFLQNQTRIWLGEVLNKRFEKEMSISDLLADGQILFGMYKLFRKLLLVEDHSSRQKFPERESVSSSEITEIFPYAKVERFLEVCQSLGLSDIDLFTTSDVVDKRNTRKVCMCLRFLAKKARSRNLKVPDFDSVTHRKKSPVTMPTDMVGNRRRDLERSSSSPVPDSHDSRKGSRQSQQEESAGSHPDSTSYKSDVSDDDCESYSMVGGGSTDYSPNDTSPRTPDPSMVQNFSSVERELELLNGECPDEDENVENECMSAAESVDIASPSQGHRSVVGDNFQLVDHQTNHVGDSLPSHSSNFLDWQDASSPMDKANDTAYDEPESNGDSGYNENADLPEASSVGMEEVFAHLVEVNMNDKETTEESVSFVEDNSGHNNPLPAAAHADTFSSSSPKQESGKGSRFDTESEETTQQGKGVDLGCENFRDIVCIEDMKSHHGKSEGLEICSKDNSQHREGTNDLPCTEIDDNDDREDSIDEFKNVAQQCKPPRKKMLKLVAGGTGTMAAVGLLLFWLQLRKKGTQNADSLTNPTRIAATEKRSTPEKQERTSTNKIYPANRLKFG